MKIICGDYFWKNIQFVCERYNCVYEVESKEDWSIDFHISFPYKYDIPHYSVVCPNCGNIINLGYDQEDLQDTEAANTLCYYIPLLKQRSDWNDKFRIERKLRS